MNKDNNKPIIVTFSDKWNNDNFMRYHASADFSNKESKTDITCFTKYRPNNMIWNNYKKDETNAKDVYNGIFCKEYKSFTIEDLKEMINELFNRKGRDLKPIINYNSIINLYNYYKSYFPDITLEEVEDRINKGTINELHSKITELNNKQSNDDKIEIEICGHKIYIDKNEYYENKKFTKDKETNFPHGI